MNSYERSDLWHFNVLCKFMFEELEPCGFEAASPDVVLFDCGANRGIWTRAFIETYASSRISAHLFEPSSRNAAEISRLQSAFWPSAPHAQVHVNAQAVGGECGEMTLHADSEGSFQASLCEGVVGESRFRESVPVTTIDTYMTEHAIEHIDFLKLDVEGWELQALQGAGAALRRGAVSAIFFEFSAANVMTRSFFQDFWKLLGPLGFDFYYLDRTKLRLLPVTAYDNGKWERFWGTHYFYCRHRSWLASIGLQPIVIRRLAATSKRATGARVALRAIQLPGVPDYRHPTRYVVGDAWMWEGEIWTSTAISDLQCWVPRGRTVRLVFETGPDCGSVEIDWQGHRHALELYAARPDVQNVVLTEGRVLV